MTTSSALTPPPMHHPVFHHSMAYGTLATAVACLIALGLVGWQMRRRPALSNGATRALALFLGIQAVAGLSMFAMPHLHVFSQHDGFLASTFLEIASAAVLLYACARAPQALRSADQHLARATTSEREYSRARSDYEQLMRHRIANPITIITGASDLLARPELLTPEQRSELLQAVMDAARQLEHLDLDPHRLGPEEVCFDAIPTIDSSTDAGRQAVGTAPGVARTELHIVA